MYMVTIAIVTAVTRFTLIASVKNINDYILYINISLYLHMLLHTVD